MFELHVIVSSSMLNRSGSNYHLVVSIVCGDGGDASGDVEIRLICVA